MVWKQTHKLDTKQPAISQVHLAEFSDLYPAYLNDVLTAEYHLTSTK